MNDIIYILEFVFSSIKSIIIFFSIGISLATLIKVKQLDQKMQTFFANKNRTSIPIAVGTGSLSPLCSCGVIPAIAALLTAGVPLAPIMAFWITSPLMDPESFFLTLGLLGKDIAVARLVSTILMGFIAGYLTLILSNRGYLNNQVLKKEVLGCSKCNEELNIPFHQKYAKEFIKLSIYVGKFLILAFILEALIVLYVPMNWVPDVLGSSNPYGPIIAAILGIPAYASTYASMPIVRTMLDLGMDKGTALSFMIAGAATSIPAMVAVFSLVKKRTFLVYVSYSLIGTMIAGYIFRLFI